MLCTSFKKYGETVPIIDLLISYIPNEHGDTWTDLEPTFTSSLKRHLVLQTSFKKDMLTEGSASIVCLYHYTYSINNVHKCYEDKGTITEIS